MSELRFVRLGFGPDKVDYVEAWEEQRRVHAARFADEAPDTCLLLEHPSVYTAGRRTADNERPLDGTPVVDVDRGGKITWHGPGQLVGYPIQKLPRPVDVVAHVRRLEEALIRTCAEFGLETSRVEGRSGVWVLGDPVERRLEGLQQALLLSRGETGIGDRGLAIGLGPRLLGGQGRAPREGADRLPSKRRPYPGRMRVDSDIARLVDPVDAALADASVMRKALQYARMFDALIMQHCEEPTLTRRASMHAGDVATRLGGPDATPHDRWLLDTGVPRYSPDGTFMGPPMSFGWYKRMSDTDVRAIAMYIKSVPAVRNEVPASTFSIPGGPPANIYGPIVTSVPDVPKTDIVKYGEYLAGPIGHCMDCHTTYVMGQIDMAQLGRGGNVYTKPFIYDWAAVSANITSHPEAGLGAWSDDEIKRAITKGISRDGRELLPFMPYWLYDKMEPSDLDAIVAMSLDPHPALLQLVEEGLGGHRALGGQE